MFNIMPLPRAGYLLHAIGLIMVLATTSRQAVFAQGEPKASSPNPLAIATLTETQSSADANNRLAAIQKLPPAQQGELLWEAAALLESKPGSYLQANLGYIYNLLGALTGNDFGLHKRDKAYALAQRIAISILQSGDDLPLRVELNFLDFLLVNPADYAYPDEPNEPNSVAEHTAPLATRATKIKLLLHAVKRIHEGILLGEPIFPRVPFAFPAGTTGTNSKDPVSIRDPEVRAKYEASLAEMAKLSQQSYTYRSATLAQETWLPDVVRYIYTQYTDSPADQKELRELIAASGVPAGMVDKSKVPPPVEVAPAEGAQTLTFTP